MVKGRSGGGLSFQRVAPQVLSLRAVFTAVFGMGTGGILSLNHLTNAVVSHTLKTAQRHQV